MKAFEPKCVNSILYIIGFNSLMHKNFHIVCILCVICDLMELSFKNQEKRIKLWITVIWFNQLIKRVNRGL